MKKVNILSVTLLSVTLAYPTLTLADNTSSNNLLTGDVRLACEAILCLSSGDRPHECVPSIKRYFSINHKRLKDTLNARRNFLNLCPTSKKDKGMDNLVHALVNGAGRCDATELNRMMKRSYKERVCPTTRINRENDGCYFVTKYYISRDKPSYCSAYFNHEWTTAGDKVRFIGQEKQGGKWVDIK